MKALTRFVEKAEQIVELFAFDVGEDNALVSLTDGSIGIATRGQKGYRPSKIGLAKYDYDKLSDLVDQANKILFKDRTEKETMLIVLRSMR